MTKQQLVSELADSAGLSKSKITNLLNSLSEISYREASNGFTIPGICKLKVIRKKPSRHRNPATGKMMLIGERDVLKIVPLKKAKTAITPNLDVEVTILEDEPRQQEAPVPPPSGPATQTSAPQEQADEAGQIVFECAECGSLIGAPPDQAGIQCQCPLCQALNMVPVRSAESSASDDLSDAGSMALNDFVTFICQTCSQEIEAPIEMLGMKASCPTCNSQLDVPEEVESPAEEEPDSLATPAPEVSAETKKSMTLRIDLMDLE